MNAPTGRKARVSVIERAIAASDLPKSFAMAVSVITTRKKSNASSIQPRKPAATVAFWSVAAARGVVIVPRNGGWRYHPVNRENRARVGQEQKRARGERRD